MPSALLPAALRRTDKLESPRLLLSRLEAAKALNISERMLDTLTDPQGPLKPVKIGRRVLFSQAVLQHWIDAVTADAANKEPLMFDLVSNVRNNAQHGHENQTPETDRASPPSDRRLRGDAVSNLQEHGTR